MTHFIGVDTGGTFTDVVVLDEGGKITFEKAFSTPQDPSDGVLAGLENASRLLGLTVEELLQRTERFAHGTTVGTNTLIQRRGARVGLLMTQGFEDTALITRGPMGKNLGIPPSQAMDFIHNDRPEPLVPKSLTRGVVERIAVDGSVITPLREDSAVESVRALLQAGAESLAVCLLWSFGNDRHEQRLGELIREHAPGVPYNLSSEVAPVLGEYERVTTTIVNAFVGPLLARYVRRLQQSLADRGLRYPVQLMTASGGLTMPAHVDREAAALVNSGPIGGLVAAKFLGDALGLSNILTTDMGGTSFDVGLIHEGEFEYEQTPFLAQGLPVRVPAAKMVTLGAGGGSIASTDGYRLLVGPQSAGAEPGPVCYGTGGTEPTVTDALVVLGILDPNHFFGGRRTLDRSKAEHAIKERVADPLNLDVREAAAGIYEIVTAKMSDLIRKVTVESGYDPRQFTIFAYGGASPAHAVPYAESLGVQEVVVPFTSSVFSALGCALSDIKYAYVRSEPVELAGTNEAVASMRRVFDSLERRALDEMASLGYDGTEVGLSRRVDMRYEGQMSELTIPCPGGMVAEQTLDALRDTFERTYHARFGQGTTLPSAALEIVSFRVEALRRTVKPTLTPLPEGSPDPSPAQKGEREIYLRHLGALSARVYDGSRLAPGHVLHGPAIIERSDTTVLVPPNHTARIDAYLNVRIKAAATEGAERCA